MASIRTSSAYRADVASVAATCDFSALAGRTVLVTGSSGLVGSAFADLLLAANDSRGTGVRVCAAARDPAVVLGRFGRRPDLVPVAYDALRPNDFPFAADYVVHAASNASPDRYVSEPVETMVANFCGLLELLRYARRAGTSRLLYVSSSEIYGRLAHPGPYGDAEYGVVDLLDVRSSYPMAKRAAETLAASYAAEYGLDVSIVRPGHVYGPTASPRDRRVSSDFAFKAAAGRDLFLKSDGAQVRSYCHCLDCATAMLAVLTHGASGRAYNVSNPESVVSIREMAALLAKAGGVVLRQETATPGETAAFNPMDDSSLDAAPLLALGWRPAFPAEVGLRRTVEALREAAEGGRP